MVLRRYLLLLLLLLTPAVMPHAYSQVEAQQEPQQRDTSETSADATRRFQFYVDLDATLDNQQHVQELIRQLGSESFEQREAAHQQLERYSVAALDLLRQHINNPDPEIAYRCKALLKDNLWINTGMMVTRIVTNMQAGTLGFQPGDVVMKVNETNIVVFDDLYQTIQVHPRTFYVLRDRKLYTVDPAAGLVGIVTTPFDVELGGMAYQRAVRAAYHRNYAMAYQAITEAEREGLKKTNDAYALLLISGLANSQMHREQALGAMRDFATMSNNRMELYLHQFSRSDMFDLPIEGPLVATILKNEPPAQADSQAHYQWLIQAMKLTEGRLRDTSALRGFDRALDQLRMAVERETAYAGLNPQLIHLHLMDRRFDRISHQFEPESGDLWRWYQVGMLYDRDTQRLAAATMSRALDQAAHARRVMPEEQLDPNGIWALPAISAARLDDEEDLAMQVFNAWQRLGDRATAMAEYPMMAMLRLPMTAPMLTPAMVRRFDASASPAGRIEILAGYARLEQLTYTQWIKAWEKLAPDLHDDPAALHWHLASLMRFGDYDQVHMLLDEHAAHLRPHWAGAIRQTINFMQRHKRDHPQRHAQLEGVVRIYLFDDEAFAHRYDGTLLHLDADNRIGRYAGRWNGRRPTDFFAANVQRIDGRYVTLDASPDHPQWMYEPSYVLDRKQKRWVDVRRTESVLAVKPAEVHAWHRVHHALYRKAVARDRDVDAHYRYASEGRADDLYLMNTLPAWVASRQTWARRWYAMWVHPNRLYLYDLKRNSMIDVQQKIAEQSERAASEIQIYRPHSFEDHGHTLIPTDRALWRFDHGTGALEGVALPEALDLGLPIVITHWATDPEQVLLASAPAYPFRHQLMDRNAPAPGTPNVARYNAGDGTVTMTQGLEGRGPDDTYFALHEDDRPWGLDALWHWHAWRDFHAEARQQGRDIWVEPGRE